MAVAITLAAVALLAAVVCAVGWRRTADRLTRLEGRVTAVEREVQTEVRPELDRSRRDSEAAVFAARRATAAVGIEEPPPRLAAESMTAPVVRAIGAARADVRDQPAGRVPAHLRDAHYPGAARLGPGDGYRYPHDEPSGWVDQEYRPPEVAGRRYFVPEERLELPRTEEE